MSARNNGFNINLVIVIFLPAERGMLLVVFSVQFIAETFTLYHISTFLFTILSAFILLTYLTYSHIVWVSEWETT